MILNADVAAIVTGAASGLGEATARALAASGVKVAIFDTNAERGSVVAREIGGVFCQTDVTSEDSVIAAFEAARTAHGQERIVVNCAGIAPAQRTVSKNGPHDMALFETVIRINLIGSYRVLSKAAAGMATLDPVDAAGERGVCISTASVAAFDGQVGQAAYSASKAAIAGMTLPVARDLTQLGIRVCTIAPGIFGTPLLKAMPQEVQDSLARQVPFPSRLGEPEEFASLVTHICTNGYLNGEVIRLDGAIRMAPR